MKSYYHGGGALIHYDWSAIKRRDLETDTQGKHHVKLKAEIRVVKQNQKNEKLRDRHRIDSPLRPLS